MTKQNSTCRPLNTFKSNTALTRRQFVGVAASTAAVALLSPVLRSVAAPAKRTATDLVPLGKTGLKICRLGMGTGSSGGRVQFELGKEGFIKLVHYAYDQGITYFDAAQNYKTFDWIGDAIKGLPREKIFIQSKVPGQPEDVLATIDRHRKTYNTDYVDSMLIHCMVKNGWTDQWKRIMDAFDKAQEKKWILSKGVSCHSLPALHTATTSPWPQVHLVRVNPQAKVIDGPEETWNKPGTDVTPVLTDLQRMHDQGRGTIGMKIYAEGTFDAANREKSIRFAMSRPDLDCIVIGFKDRAQIDETIKLMNAALA